MVGVEKSKRSLASKPLKYIDTCPECNTPLIRKEGEAKHFCPNENGCPPQLKGKIEHFVSRKAMDIGLAEATIEQLFNQGLLKDSADLYDLKKEDLLKLERFADKSAENLVNSIAESVKIPFGRVLYALGIRYVGETVAKKLANHFKHIESLESASIEDLLNVEEIGDKIAESIIEYFSIEKNRKLVSRLKKAGITLSLSENETSKLSNRLDGKSIVISGVFSKYSRDELKELIEKNGGKNVSSVSANTDYILAGENMGPAKLKKAEDMGIPVIDEDEFLKMINII